MNPYVSVLVNDVLPVLVVALVPILGTLLAWVLKLLQQKTGIDIGAAQQQMLVDAINHGIGYAEQWALNKAKIEGAPPPSAAKLDEALKYTLDALDKSGIVGQTRDQLVKLIEARLGLANMAAPPAP